MYSSGFNNSMNKTPAGDINTSQMSKIGSPQEQSTPAFLFGKRRSAAHPGSMFTNSPLSGPSAPTNDIFASPAPSAIPSHIKDTTTGSGKSVHWSPSLVQEKSSAASPMFGGQAATNPSASSAIPSKPAPTSFASPALNAPPLRSLRDEIEPVKKLARRNTFAARTTTPSSKTTLDTIASAAEATPSESAADTWVTVFGFPSNQIATILKLFSRHGEVVSHQTPSRGNWMHLRYSCVTHAQQALSRNGQLLDAETFIGVVPCTDKDIRNGTATGVVARSTTDNSMFHSIREEDESSYIPSVTMSRVDPQNNENTLNGSMLNMSNFDANTSLNASRLSTRSGVGMRSLAVDKRVNTMAQNKQDGLLNKLWNTIGF